MIETSWRHIHHVLTVKKQITSKENVGGDQTLSAENMVRLDTLKESADHNNINMKKKMNPIAQQPEEEQLFVASCFTTSNNSNNSLLIDSGFIKHMQIIRNCSRNLTKLLFSKSKLEMVIILLSKANELLL
jgi:hypothetical protein